MTTIRLDKGGKLELPRDMLDSHDWQAGAEFTIEDRPEGLLLRPLTGDLKAVKAAPVGNGASGGTAGRDRTLAAAMRDRYARLGH